MFDIVFSVITGQVVGAMTMAFGGPGWAGFACAVTCTLVTLSVSVLYREIRALKE